MPALQRMLDHTDESSDELEQAVAKGAVLVPVLVLVLVLVLVARARRTAQAVPAVIEVLARRRGKRK